MSQWERKIVRLKAVPKRLVFRAQEIDKMEAQTASLQEGCRTHIQFLIDDLRKLFSEKELKEAGLE